MSQSFQIHPPSINFEELYFSILWNFLKSFLLFLSRLLLLGERGRYRLSQKPSMSLSQLWIWSHQYHCKSSFLVLSSQWEHVPQTSTWSPVPAQAMDLMQYRHYMSFCHSRRQRHPHSLQGNMDREHQYDPWQQRCPWTSAWLQVAPQTTVSTCPSEVTQAMDINTTPNCSRTWTPTYVSTLKVIHNTVSLRVSSIAIIFQGSPCSPYEVTMIKMNELKWKNTHTFADTYIWRNKRLFYMSS